jgi:hypothetical protein
VPPPTSLGPAAIHALSNDLSVVLGFIELVLADTPLDHPRRPDLLEIRDAAIRAAGVISGGSPPTS